jgi:dipicolinate synthase subunit B
LIFENINIGFGITGSFCNFYRIKEIMEDLIKEGANIIPIISENSKNFNTRFFNNKEFIEMLEETTKNEVIDSIIKAEPIGPKKMIDILVILPCTGNTVAKLSSGITDTTVLMAAKGHIRNNKPVVIGISTNDGLGNNLKNIRKFN